MNRRGVFFFIVDVLIGILIFLVTVIVVSSFFSTRSSIGGTEQYLDVVREDFFRQSVGDLGAQYTSLLPVEYRGFDQLRVDELLYYLSEGDAVALAASQSLIAQLIDDSLPAQFGFSYEIDGVLLYDRASPRYTSSSTAKTTLVAKKITVLAINPETVFAPVVTEVKLWS